MTIKPTSGSLIQASSLVSAIRRPSQTESHFVIPGIASTRADLSRITQAGEQPPFLWRSQDLMVLQTRAVRGDALAADALANRLALNFGATIPGATVELLEASALEFPEIENVMGRGRVFIQEVLNRLGPERANGESGKVVKIRYRTKNYHHRGGIRYFLHDIERILENRLRITYFNKEEGVETVWIFTPGFIETSLQKVFGPESVRWRYVKGDAETKSILAAYGSGERVVALPVKDIVLEDVEVKRSKRKREIPPLIFLVHDQAHGAYFAKHHQIRWAVLELRNLIWKLPKLFARDHMQGTLDALSNMDFDESTLEGLVIYAFQRPMLRSRNQQGEWIDQFLRHLSRSVMDGTVSEDLFQTVSRRLELIA